MSKTDFKIKDYTIHFKNPTENKTRIATLIKNETDVKVDTEFKNPILLISSNTWQIFSIYREFKKEKKESYIDLMKEIIEEIKSRIQKNKSLYIVGDLNLDYRRINDNQYSNYKIYEEWQKFYDERCLIQHIKETTWERIIKGKVKSSILDHLYTENEEEKHHLVRVPFSDHQIVQFKLKTDVKRLAKTGIFRRSLRNYNCEELKNKVQRKLGKENNLNVEAHAEYLEETLLSELDSMCPEKYIKNKYIPFMWDEKILQLKKKRDNLYKKSKKNGNIQGLERTRLMDREIRRKIKASFRDNFRKKFTSKERFDLWKGVKNANGEEHEIEKTIKYKKDTAFNINKGAKLFLKSFDEKVKEINESEKIDEDIFNGYTLVQDVEERNPFNYTNLDQSVSQLRRKGSYGHDRVPMFLIKDAWPTIRESVKNLFDKINESKKIPEKWKIGRVLPLHKKGDKSEAGNYRPITNLCTLAKIYERCIKLELESISKEKFLDLTGDQQYAYKKGSSTNLAAINLKRNIIEQMENKKWAGIVSLDLSSAFDVVNHELLHKRIEKLGIPTGIRELIKEWLTGRTHYVEYGSRCSEPSKIEHGTVQGSVMGPILFSIFIQPLLQMEDLIIYADDTYIDEGDETLNGLREKLETKVGRIVKWLSNSGLKINFEKTEFCVFNKTKMEQISIKVGDLNIASKKSIKVLGLIFDSKLDWHLQVEQATKKTKKAIFGLKKLRRFLSEDELMFVARSCCFSILYFGASVFLHPGLRKDLLQKLLGVSTLIIKTCYMLWDWSLVGYDEIHELSNTATPKMWSDYTQAMTMYDTVMNGTERNSRATRAIMSNEVRETRLRKLYYNRTNKTRAGRQLIENSLHDIAKHLPYEWMNMTRSNFKSTMKKTFLRY